MFRTQGRRPAPARASIRGWSLVELLSTLTILGVVSATAAPSPTAHREAETAKAHRG